MKPLFDPKKLPLERRSVSLVGIRTAYWEGGTPGAEPIIFLHGLNGSHHGLWPLATRFMDYHVFLPDLPGHGGSGLPEHARVEGVVGWFDKFIRKVAEITGRKPIVVAHSFGAQIAFMSCRQVPGEYTKCILLTPVPRASILPHMYGKSLALLPRRIALELAGSSERARIWRGSFLLHRHTPETRALISWNARQSANNPDKFAYYIAISQALMDIHAYNKADISSDDYYCVSGDHDRMLTPDALDTLREMFGASHFFICKETGHLMPLEAPDETASIIRKILG